MGASGTYRRGSLGSFNRILHLGCIVCSVALLCLAVEAEAAIELWPDRLGSTFGSFLPTTGRASLLDPSRLGISNQLVFSYSSGSGAKGNVGGLWLTNFSYRFSSPLRVDLSVGASLTNSGPRELNAQNLFLQSFSVRYTPNENLYFHFMYNQVPSSLFLYPDSRLR